MTSSPPAVDTPDEASAPSGPVRLREVEKGTIRFSVPGTDYQLEAAPGKRVPASVKAGQRLDGALHVTARKVWPVSAGGRFVEPVFGRPRRLQGVVVGTDDAANALWVDAGGLKVVAILGHAGQQAAHFPVQGLVTFGVDDHTVFETAPAP